MAKITVRQPRATLEELVELERNLRKLGESHALGLQTWRKTVVLRRLLVDVIEALGPKFDERTDTAVWVLAILAAALVDHRRMKVKAAICLAIDTLDQKQSIELAEQAASAYRRLRRGDVPAGLLMSCPPELLQAALDKM